MSFIGPEKVDFIKEFIPSLKGQFKVQFELTEKFSSETNEYRQQIRQHLGNNFSYAFNRQQLAELSDLNKIPIASEGYFSISHCRKLGGFSYSTHAHGFDLEQVDRISKAVILRTCSEKEVSEAPNAQFLWVAKEAAIKAMTSTKSSLVITDLVCETWKSYCEANIFSYRITSKKTLDFNFNIGFVFSEKDILFGFFIK